MGNGWADAANTAMGGLAGYANYQQGQQKKQQQTADQNAAAAQTSQQKILRDAIQYDLAQLADPDEAKMRAAAKSLEKKVRDPKFIKSYWGYEPDPKALKGWLESIPEGAFSSELKTRKELMEMFRKDVGLDTSITRKILAKFQEEKQTETDRSEYLKKLMKNIQGLSPERQQKFIDKMKPQDRQDLGAMGFFGAEVPEEPEEPMSEMEDLKLQEMRHKVGGLGQPDQPDIADVGAVQRQLSEYEMKDADGNVTSTTLSPEQQGAHIRASGLKPVAMFEPTGQAQGHYRPAPGTMYRPEIPPAPPAQPMGQQAPPMPQGQYPDGFEAVNPQTGQKMVMQGGQWQAVQ